MAPADAEVGGEQAHIMIKIAHPDDADPGFSQVNGTLEPFEPGISY